MLCKLILVIAGLAFGLLVAGGVFTVLVAVGLVPRFAAKTRSAHCVKVYETAIIYGTVIGCIASVFPWEDIISYKSSGIPALVFRTGTGIWGLFAGIFVGCFAMAVAEMLNSIPIFARRIRFQTGLRYAVWALAIGKMAGSILYFYYSFNLYQ